MDTKPILFVDFDGTICHQRYWRSLPKDEYEKIQDLLFREDTVIVRSWMLGKYRAEEVHTIVAEKAGIPYERLWSVFVSDCTTMEIAPSILQKISILRSAYTLVLVTVNMDSFTRFTVPALKLENYFDHISNSFYEGKHKAENGGELFLEYAKKYGVPISTCVAIDDSLKVCEVFKTLGGTAYHVTPEHGAEEYLEYLIK